MRRIWMILAALAVVAALTACRPKDGATEVASSEQPPGSSPSATFDAERTSSPTPEAVPTPSSPSPSPSPSRSPSPVCNAGQNQREVEQILAAMGGYGNIQVDGQQSDSDCAAIKKFQRRFGLRPVDGVPGSATLNVAKRLHDSDPR